MTGWLVGLQQHRTVMWFELAMTLRCRISFGVADDVLLLFRTSHDGSDHTHDGAL